MAVEFNLNGSRIRLDIDPATPLLEALRNDPAYIEHLARRRLGLVKPDEIVLQLPRRKSTP